VGKYEKAWKMRSAMWQKIAKGETIRMAAPSALGFGFLGIIPVGNELSKPNLYCSNEAVNDS
jgi:hypothetical protein